MSRDKLQQAMVEDFHKIIAYSPLLQEAFDGLPDDQRLTIEDRWLEWCWQMVLAHAEPMIRSNARSAGKTFEQFGAFIMNCKAGKRIQFHGPEWVAMDRVSYDELRKKAYPLQIISESDPGLNT